MFTGNFKALNQISHLHLRQMGRHLCQIKGWQKTHCLNHGWPKLNGPVEATCKKQQNRQTD